MKFFSKPNLKATPRARIIAALEDVDGGDIDIEVAEATDLADAAAPVDAGGVGEVPAAGGDTEVSLDVDVDVAPEGPVDEVTGEPLPPVEGEEVDVETTIDEEAPVDLGVAGGDADLAGGADELAESNAESADADELVEGVTALEGIYDMVAAMPDIGGKLSGAILTGMRPALEANDLVARNNSALVPSDGDKQGMLSNIKEFLKKAIEALVKLVMSFIDGIKAAWANATDRLVRASNAAKQAKAKLGSVKFQANASISDEKLMNAIATAGNISVTEAMTNAFSHAQAMGERGTSEMLGNAGVAIRAIASGSAQEDTMQKLYGNIEGLAGYYPEKGIEVKGKQANGTKPFFGGYRAWASLPASMEDIGEFSHGLEKVDEVGAQGQLNAASQQECGSICDAIIKAAQMVPQYRRKLAEEEKLAGEIKSAANVSGEGTEEAKAMMTKLTKLLPKIVKGPQVAAYSYAGTAAAIGIRYVSASIAAQGATGASDVKAIGQEKGKLPAPNRNAPQLAAPAAGQLK